MELLKKVIKDSTPNTSPLIRQIKLNNFISYDDQKLAQFIDHELYHGNRGLLTRLQHNSVSLARGDDDVIASFIKQRADVDTVVISHIVYEDIELTSLANRYPKEREGVIALSSHKYLVKTDLGVWREVNIIVDPSIEMGMPSPQQNILFLCSKDIVVEAESGEGQEVRVRVGIQNLDKHLLVKNYYPKRLLELAKDMKLEESNPFRVRRADEWANYILPDDTDSGLAGNRESFTKQLDELEKTIRVRLFD